MLALGAVALVLAQTISVDALRHPSRCVLVIPGKLLCVDDDKECLQSDVGSYMSLADRFGPKGGFELSPDDTSKQEDGLPSIQIYASYPFVVVDGRIHRFASGNGSTAPPGAVGLIAQFEEVVRDPDGSILGRQPAVPPVAISESGVMYLRFSLREPVMVLTVRDFKGAELGTYEIRVGGLSDEAAADFRYGITDEHSVHLDPFLVVGKRYVLFQSLSEGVGLLDLAARALVCEDVEPLSIAVDGLGFACSNPGRPTRNGLLRFQCGTLSWTPEAPSPPPQK